MGDTREHWDQAYRTKAEAEVSWFQERPESSRRLVESATPDHGAAIIDVGGGSSRLVDLLLDDGYTDLTVLDISAAALDRSRARLGDRAANVTWIVADLTTWIPDRTRSVWHDRAVFHFLIGQAQQDAYIATLRRATGSGATVIIATFALDGPDRCSGLPVLRYSPATLGDRLGSDFSLVAETNEMHRTPAGKPQSFVYSVFKRAA